MIKSIIIIIIFVLVPLSIFYGIISTIRYYITRKFDSIDKYNSMVGNQFQTYKESQTQYDKNVEDIGLSNNHFKVLRIFKKLNEFVKNFRNK